MKIVTFDSTTGANDPIVSLAEQRGWDVAFTTVTEREAEGTSFAIGLARHGKLTEIGVWDESRYDAARFGRDTSGARFDEIPGIISHGSFPRDRANLSEGYKHQLRDAMLLEAHVNAGRDVFVSAAVKHFVNKAQMLKSILQFRLSRERSNHLIPS